MDASFESRVWTRALDRGLLTTAQVNACLKEFRAESPTLQLTELLLAKGHLTAEQVAALRGEVAGADPAVPDEVRVAARDPRNLLGRYVLLSELGRGGMGIVYKAWDGDLRRPIALKVLSGPWNAEDLARFRREAQMAAGLRHLNIITVYEIGPSDENPYIALEYIEGETLHGRKLPSRKAAELTVTIARAVESAHRSGIIHRDLKPANIMIDADGNPRVMDFGLARPEVSSSQITMSGTVVGTPAYMSPEQAQGRVAEIDHRSDVYSLGAMLYELLTGRAPFRGETPLETLTAVVAHPPVRPRRITSTIPRPLEAIVLQCLRKRREDRYDTAEALAQDLERFLRGESVRARSPGSAGPWVAVGGAVAAFAVATVILFRTPPPPPPVATPAPVKVVDRNQLDRGLRLMEESRRDLYRPNAPLDKTKERLQEAERCFDAAIEADPASGEARLARAEARLRQGRLKDARPDYAEAIRLLPTSPSARLARGHALLDRFMDEVAMLSWLKAELPEELTADRDQAREDFQKALRLSPSKDELVFLRICLDIAEERFEEAVAATSSAAETAERPEEIHKLRGDAYAMRGSNGFSRPVRADDLGRAVEEYSRAIKLRVNYADAYQRRGAALWLLGRPDESLSDFQAVVVMNPTDSRALGDLATAYYHSNQEALAIDYYNRAIAADPDNLRARTNRGGILLQKNKIVEAREDLEHAVRLNPLHLAAQFNLAVAVYKSGDRPEGLRQMTVILEKVPMFAKGLSVRAMMNTEMERWKEGLGDCDLALKLDPSLAGALRPIRERCLRGMGR